MKKCNSCNAQNPGDAKFCWSCGREFQQVSFRCPHCKSLIDKFNKKISHCPYCGWKVQLSQAIGMRTPASADKDILKELDNLLNA